MSTKGHAILRAPDGETTMSVSRDSLRGRSGRNARAVLDRWQKQQDTNQGDEPVKSDDPNPFKCADCDRAYPFAEYLDNHRRKKHPTPSQEVEVTVTDVETTPPAPVDDVPLSKKGIPLKYLCPDCDRRFTLSAYLRRHRELEHGVAVAIPKKPKAKKGTGRMGVVPGSKREHKYVCPDCGKPYAYVNFYDKHRKDEHLASQADIDAEVKAAQDAADAPPEQSSEAGSYHCTKCNRTFYTDTALELHEAAHEMAEEPGPVVAYDLTDEDVPEPASVPETAADGPGDAPRPVGAIAAHAWRNREVEDGEQCQVCGGRYSLVVAHMTDSHTVAELAETVQRVQTGCEAQAQALADAEARLTLAREALGMQ